MKKLLLSALAIASVSAPAFAQEKPDSAGFVFTDIKVVPTNSVKDQNKSGTCWSFSATSFFEDEILRKTGKSVDLSEMFTVRECYNDKADNYVRRYGVAQFSQGGSCPDIAYVWERYGAMPEEAYRGLNYGEDNHVHGELESGLKAYLDVIVRKPNRRLSTAWPVAKKGILDAYFGEVPESFQYEGKTYTPQSFAKMLGLNMSDYVPVTSFTHHPFYTQFPVEVADNWLWATYHNVPLEEMKAIVDNALDKGYSIAWAADVSEPGFKWIDGFAVIPKKKTEADLSGTELSRWVKLSDKDREKEANEVKSPREEITVTQELRQEMFDTQETTDDHGMVIMGKAVDQNGTRYYKVKNSWDTNHKYGGFFYVSEPYFLAKTIDILVHRDAIPADIAKKMNLSKK